MTHFQERSIREVRSRLLSVLIFTGFAASAGPFFVAPAGNDAWSGKLARPNSARSDGPFHTLDRARRAIRAARAAGRSGPFVVEVRGGMYFLDRPLRFGPADSGTAGAPVIYRAFPGEHPIFSGGRRITGFRRIQFQGRECWTASVPWARHALYFHQLYVRRRGARYFQRRFRPVKGMLTTAGLTYSPARKAAPHRAAQRDFIFHEGDFQKWRALSDIEVVVFHSWSISRLYVEHLDFSRRVVRFTAFPTFRIGYWYGPRRNPYWIENIREELKHPGQWYLDRTEGKLYYLPMPGETPENTEIVAPVLETLLELAGDAGPGKKPDFVEYLRFEGLGFAHAAWAPPRNGYDVSQGQPTLPAAIEWAWARHCTLFRCEVADTGAYAVALGRGCSDDRIAGCFLHDLGGGGVKIGDSAMKRTAPPPELPQDCRVENNVIADGGIVNFSANAVWAGIVRGLRIRHNEIRNFPYTGIAVGWCWGTATTSAANNAIEYNHVHNVMRLIEDGGGIYTLGQQPGTVIRGNCIHDCFRGRFACGSGQMGIYLDEGSGPFRIEKNLVYDVQMGGFNAHRARGNLVRNNIFAFIRQDPITNCRTFSPAYTFEHNIVCLRQRNMLSRRCDPGKGGKTRFDYNLYWSLSGKPPRFAGRRLEQWRKLGQDRHSRVAAPGFADLTRRDFRLRHDSPAFQLGIDPPKPGAAGLEPEFRDVDDPTAPVPSPPVYAMKPRALPPLDPNLDLDFEQIPPGRCPREFTCAGCFPGKGGFRVTDRIAFHGKRSLEGWETARLPRPFYPYLIRNFRLPKTLRSGIVRFAFALRNSAKQPARISVEFRDYKHSGRREFLEGPQLIFTPAGTLRAGRARLAQTPNGHWWQVLVTFAYGKRAPKRFTVTVRDAAGTPIVERKLAWRDPGFIEPTWLGIISADSRPAVFHLDDLRLTVRARP